MQVQQIANTQNFEGRFIKIGNFSDTFLKDFKAAKKALQDRVIFAPFDIYVKLNKGNGCLYPQVRILIKNILLRTTVFRKQPLKDTGMHTKKCVMILPKKYKKNPSGKNLNIFSE